MHYQQAFGLILFGFIVGVCFMTAVGIPLICKAQGWRVGDNDRKRAADEFAFRDDDRTREAQEAGLRG